MRRSLAASALVVTGVTTLAMASLAGAQPSAEETPTLPVVRALWPAEVPAGRAFTLEVEGDEFTDDTRVHVEVNLHAGSRRAPEYALRAFPTERIDERTLEVRFERGFYGTPAVRELVVVRPDGGRSAPALLRITDPEPTAETPED